MIVPRIRARSRVRRAWCLTAAAFALVIGCGDSADPGHGPGTEGPPFFSARLDGAAWSPDTMTAMAIGAPTDTSLSVAAALTLGDTAEQYVTVAVAGFHGTGNYPLAGGGTPGFGAFFISQVDSGWVTGTLVFRTDSVRTGMLKVTGFDRVDSIVSGTFSFEAAADPDTAGHRRLSGQFRIRYRFQEVFVP